MKVIFIELFEYNYYNQQSADRFEVDHEHLSKKITRLYAHVLNAHHIWISGIESAKISLGVWEIHSPEYCKSIDKINHEKRSRF